MLAYTMFSKRCKQSITIWLAGAGSLGISSSRQQQPSCCCRDCSLWVFWTCRFFCCTAKLCLNLNARKFHFLHFQRNFHPQSFGVPKKGLPVGNSMACHMHLLSQAPTKWGLVGGKGCLLSSCVDMLSRKSDTWAGLRGWMKKKDFSWECSCAFLS